MPGLLITGVFGCGGTWTGGFGLVAAVTVQVKLVLPEAPDASLAVTVTVEDPTVLGVPEMIPAEVIDNPDGRPLAR